MRNFNWWRKKQLDLFKPESLWGDWLDELMEKCDIPYGTVRRTCKCGIEYEFLADRKKEILCNYRCYACPDDGSWMFSQNIVRVKADGVTVYEHLGLQRKRRRERIEAGDIIE